MSIASQELSGKKTSYLRIATEEAYLPQEIPGLYRELLAEKTVDDPGFLSNWGYFLGNAERMQKLASRLVDIGEGRIRDMDSTGIARQILSIASPGVQIFEFRNRDVACQIFQRRVGASDREASRSVLGPGGHRAAEPGRRGQGA